MSDFIPTPPNPPPTPVPVAALPYSVPMYRQRPGIVTAIGVISIVIACFSMIASLGTGCQATTYYMLSKMSRTMASSSAVTTYSVGAGNGNGIAAAPASGSNVSANGLGPADRQEAISTLAAMQPLNAQRKAQLDNYLAGDGTSVFPTGGNALTARRVQIGVTSSYTHDSGGENDPGHTIYATSWGTLKIYDTRAEFVPRDGSGVRTFSADTSGNASTQSDPTAQVAASSDPSAATQPAGSPSTGTALTPAEVQAIVQKAQQATGNKLSAIQLQSLTAELQKPYQDLIAPGTAWSPIRSASIDANGDAWVWFSSGYASISPQGQITTNNFAMPTYRVNPVACVLAVADGVLSIGLAIFLFVAGILMLGQSNAGRRLHRTFAFLKIPLAIGGTAALCWMNYEFYSSMPGMSGAGRSMPLAMAIGWGGIVGVLGLMYPICLLFALNSRAVREYYQAVRG